MAQVQLPMTAALGERPTTPSRTAAHSIPRLSPNRIPDPLAISSYKNGHLNLDTFSPVNQNGSFEFDRVLRSGKVQRRVKKKGAWKPSWKPAFLVLRPNLLSVYKNADETELRASITLSDITAVARVKKTNTDNVFGVFTPAKNYHFSGVNDRETSDWVTVLRLESRLGDVDDVDLPPPGFAPQTQNVGSDTTDLSAEDDLEPPGSSEGPGSGWSIRGNKSRHGSTSQRKPSGLRDYSGTEAFTTSQSDLSDAMVHPVAMSGIAGSNSKSKPKAQLGYAVDGPLSPSRPSFQRSTSQLSVSQIQATNPAQQSLQQDPNRVIRQAHLHLLKPVPGTHLNNWKSVWVVLRSTALSIYKSNSEYEPLKIFSVAELIDVAEIDPVKKGSKGKGEFCFQVIGLEKTMKFTAESEDELEGWIGSLKSVLAKRNRPRGHSANAVGSSLIASDVMSMSPLSGLVPPVGGPAAGLVLSQPAATGAIVGAPATGTAGNTGTGTGVTYAPIGAPYTHGGSSSGNQARLSQQHLQRPESALGGIDESLEETTIHDTK